MEVFFIKEILSDLEKMGFINEVFYDKNSDSQYQVAYSPESITIREYMKKFDTKNIEYYEDIFDNLNEEDQSILEKIREKLAMKKIEESDTEAEMSKKESTSEETEDKVEIFQNSEKHRKSDDLTIDFQISKKDKELKENFYENEPEEIFQNDEEANENEEEIQNQIDESETEDVKINYEHFESNGKKAKYEDGSWKFF